MITNKIVSASFSKTIHWGQINWQKCNRDTKRLQARIVQATKDRRWNKVKALQHLLTRSFSAKSLAVKRVTTNRGNCTAGIDGQLWQSSTSKSNAIYWPTKTKRI
jgi:RNA-directed DNA polymerase